VTTGSWFVIFAVGAACIFAVVVAVVIVVQLVRRLGEQLAEVADALRTIRGDVAAIPALGAINHDCREMNAILSGVRHDLELALRGGRS
jgi:uncharacterized protein YoxC